MHTRLLLTAAMTSFVMTGLLVWLRNNYQPVAVGTQGAERVQARAFRGSILITAALGTSCLVAALVVAAL